MASRLEHKYRWVWIDSDADHAYGTNNEEVALHYSEENIVIDVKSGKNIGTEQEVDEIDEVPDADEDE